MNNNVRLISMFNFLPFYMIVLGRHQTIMDGHQKEKKEITSSYSNCVIWVCASVAELS